MDVDVDYASSGSDQDLSEDVQLGGHEYCKIQYIKLGPVSKGKCCRWQCTHCSKIVTTESVTRLWEHFLGKIDGGSSDIKRCTQLSASAMQALQTVRDRGFDKIIPTVPVSKAKAQAKMNVLWEGAVAKLLEEFPQTSNLAADHTSHPNNMAS